jgi:hypothetical protein
VDRVKDHFCKFPKCLGALEKTYQEVINAHAFKKKEQAKSNSASMKSKFQQNVTLFFLSSGTPFYRAENIYFRKIFEDMKAEAPFAIIPTRQKMLDITRTEIIPTIQSKISNSIKTYPGL